MSSDILIRFAIYLSVKEITYLSLDVYVNTNLCIDLLYITCNSFYHNFYAIILAAYS